MVRFDEVSFGYEGTETIQGVSLHVREGEFVAIIGSNGAGKSTLSKLMNGLIKPSEGTVFLFGEDTRRLKTSRMAGKLAMLFQNPDRQICCNRVDDEIRFYLKNGKVAKAELENRVQETLEDFGFLADRNPFTLSRGERQRLVLAALLATRPRLLILDEPTTGLDYRECMEIMYRIRKYNENGMTVIMISHDMELVSDFAKRVLVLKDGRLVAEGTPHEVFRMQDRLSTASILPPQMVELGRQLSGAFSELDTYEEMTNAYEERMKEGKDKGGIAV